MLPDKNDERNSWLVINNIVLFVWEAQRRTKLESSSFAIQSLDDRTLRKKDLLKNACRLRISQHPIKSNSLSHCYYINQVVDNSIIIINMTICDDFVD